MGTKEFVARIKNGVIKLPDGCSDYEDKKVKVKITRIVSVTSDKSNYNRDGLEEIVKEVQEVDPIREIEYPVKWQREKHDEKKKSFA